MIEVLIINKELCKVQYNKNANSIKNIEKIFYFE